MTLLLIFPADTPLGFPAGKWTPRSDGEIAVMLEELTDQEQRAMLLAMRAREEEERCYTENALAVVVNK